MGMVMNPEIAGVIGFDLKDIEQDQAQIMRGKWLCNECFDDWMSYEN